MAKEKFSERVARYKKMDPQNKRRSELGVRLNIWETDPSSFSASDSRYSSDCSSDYLGSEKLTRSDRWKLLRRSKSFLSRRLVDAECFDSLTPCFQRKHSDWRDKSFPLLDYFAGLKYSYSAPLPVRVISRRRGDDVVSGRVDYFDLSFNPDGKSKKARVSDLVRSRSIRLDPVDSPKQMFLYRLRIRRCISWGYSLGFVPVMMTLTLFHRWHPLKGLLNVLSSAWNYFFTGTRMATRRAEKIGLVGYIRRAEETINNKSRRGDVKCGYNSGWHPHYHVILFVPRDKLTVLSSMEDEFREAWYQAVNRYFELEFGEQIPSSYEVSFRRHGLVFSRCFDRQHVRTNDTLTDLSGCRPPLREVDDSEYVAKIFGCEANTLYSGDTEMTSLGVKDSIIPFDLLCEDTAENNDLWVEYALATKGVKSFFFSRGLERRVQQYFEMFPDRDPVKPLPKSDNVVAQISRDAYHYFYRSFKVDEMLRVATEGYDVLREWCRQVYIDNGISEECITEEMLPQIPGSHSWVIDERRRPLTNLVDVLTNSQTQVRRDNQEGQLSLEFSVQEQSEIEHGACFERDEGQTNDNLCHVDEDADISLISSGTDKSRRFFSTSRRVVYQPSLFEPNLSLSKTRRDDAPSVESSELTKGISPARCVAPVDPRRERMLDRVEEALDSLDLVALGCADLEQYLSIWNSNDASAKSCRDFLQSQSQEVLDFKTLLNSIPLVLPSEDEPSSISSSSTSSQLRPSLLSSSSVTIQQTQSMVSQQSTESALSFSESVESSSSEPSEVQVVCDEDGALEASSFECVATDVADTVGSSNVDDSVPQVVCRSPLTVVRETFVSMAVEGQPVDWELVAFLLKELGDDSFSTLDSVDGVRLGLDLPNGNEHDEESLSDKVESRPAYLDEDCDTSFQARYDEVSKSKWYPEWYRMRLAGLAQASKKAEKTDANDLKLTGRFFMVNDFYE